MDNAKLETTPVDLSKLSDAVKNDVVKKTVYDELFKKVNATDTSKLVSKTDYNARIKYIKDKIPVIANVAITDLMDATLKDVEKKIQDVITLVKKADYDAKLSDVQKIHFTTSD